jgi:hypothetical protein
VIAPLFHAWERRLASVDTNRIVRPFEWGLEWVGLDPATPDPAAALVAYARAAVDGSTAFFGAPPGTAFTETGDTVQFPSAIQTPDVANNTVTLRVFRPKARPGAPTRGVLVLPQWNAQPDAHVGLCRLLASLGLTAVRLSLPYHDARRPAFLERADYIVSANLGRTLEVNRQAVLDARRAVDWLSRQGIDRIGILGTSLGSCLAMLTMAHDERIRAGAFNHISPYFADVVWQGLSTRHVRAGLEGRIPLEVLRDCWLPISPWPFLERLRGRAIRLIYARYDLTFPVDLSRQLIAEFSRRGVPADQVQLPCGHYTTGKAPFKFLDGYYLAGFFAARL